jgi:hypothetical protein
MEYYVNIMHEAAPIKAIEPAYARKLLRDLAAWAESIGFPPHPDFATVERILGDVNAGACDEVFQFGKDGKPYYMAGPDETPSETRRHLDRLRQRMGHDGFSATVAGDPWVVTMEPEPVPAGVPATLGTNPPS